MRSGHGHFFYFFTTAISNCSPKLVEEEEPHTTSACTTNRCEKNKIIKGVNKLFLPSFIQINATNQVIASACCHMPFFKKI